MKAHIKKILSRYVLKKIFSNLQENVFYKIIKYNKSIQNRLKINFKDSIFNYEYIIKTKSNIIQDFEELNKIEKYRYISNLSYSSKFLIKYNYCFEENINEEDEEIKFLIKYKGFKINDYPIPSNFNSLNFQEKMKVFKKNENYFKYTLSDERIKLINSINELREKNKMSLLLYNKLENLNTYFKEKKSKNDYYAFIFPLGEFKNKILTKEEDIIKILLKESFRYIIILEKELNEYIFLYSQNEEKSDKIINKTNNISKWENFHLINNTKPKIEINFSKGYKTLIYKNCIRYTGNLDYGYQLLSMINDTLIGVLEGPPDTPYENGYFLFKILFPEEYPMYPIKFCFITPIFHPNISEGGYVCVDLFNYNWAIPIGQFAKLIYSVQSLLDDPNSDDFINEFAAKLFKKDKNIYNAAVRYYTSKFANYSKFQEDLTNLNINYEIFKDEERLKYIENIVYCFEIKKNNNQT